MEKKDVILGRDDALCAFLIKPITKEDVKRIEKAGIVLAETVLKTKKVIPNGGWDLEDLLADGLIEIMADDSEQRERAFDIFSEKDLSLKDIARAFKWVPSKRTEILGLIMELDIVPSFEELMSLEIPKHAPYDIKSRKKIWDEIIGIRFDPFGTPDGPGERTLDEIAEEFAAISTVSAMEKVAGNVFINGILDEFRSHVDKSISLHEQTIERIKKFSELEGLEKFPKLKELTRKAFREFLKEVRVDTDERKIFLIFLLEFKKFFNAECQAEIEKITPPFEISDFIFFEIMDEEPELQDLCWAYIKKMGPKEEDIKALLEIEPYTPVFSAFVDLCKGSKEELFRILERETTD
jgi:hypothetical protein